jgi:hypothetical protein
LPALAPLANTKISPTTFSLTSVALACEPPISVNHNGVLTT